MDWTPTSLTKQHHGRTGAWRRHDVGENRARRGHAKPETFNFLGLTHICGRSRRGRFQLLRHTRRDRARAKVGEIKDELRQRMHQPIPEQGKWLRQVVNGFFGYHASCFARGA